jgi:ABC-2 type transport system permease protein
MNSKLKFLTKMSLLKKIKTKWFAIINIILVLVIIGIINLDSVVSFFGGDFNKKDNIVVLDNTNKIYNLFESAFDKTQNYNQQDDKKEEKISLTKTSKEEKDVVKDIKNNKTILVIFYPDTSNVVSSKIVTNSYIDPVLYQSITSSINTAKSSLAIVESNISIEDLNKLSTPVKIDREYLDESKTQSEENMSLIMGAVFPTIILPFFMLIVFMIQMLGAEINEEKTTRGMEIIISNVSPKTHFLSKILAGNMFVFIQATIFLVAGGIGLYIKNHVSNTSATLASIGINFSDIWKQLVESGVADKLVYIIPLAILLILLSFLAYSLLAGILASMTTSMEDYQQIQTPIILVCLAGYYLSMLAPTFEGSTFIRVISYIPFISALLCPSLLVIGQIGVIDVLISVSLLLAVIGLMLKYGLKVYKVGILNYSTSKLWKKMFKAAKEKEI